MRLRSVNNQKFLVLWDLQIPLVSFADAWDKFVQLAPHAVMWSSVNTNTEQTIINTLYHSDFIRYWHDGLMSTRT
jgi:hypothetical protein